MTEWFYGREGQQYGPIDEATLRARAATGEVGPDDLVWREGLETWRRYGEIFPAVDSSSVEVSGPGPGESGASGFTSPYAPPASGSLGAGGPSGPGGPATNGYAIASLVCGILSLVFFCLCGGVFFGIPAVICGHLALGQFKQANSSQHGHGLALAGLICGYCGLAIFLVLALSGEVNFDINGEGP